MKLNPDCIRDILLSVEAATDSERVFRYTAGKDNHKHLSKYTHNEIYYHMRQCSAAGLLDGFTPCDGGTLVIIGDLTPDGHEFLANVRKDSIWNSIKEVSGKIGSNSLGALMQIATNVVSSLISSHFGLS